MNAPQRPFGKAPGRSASDRERVTGFAGSDSPGQEIVRQFARGEISTTAVPATPISVAVHRLGQWIKRGLHL